MQKMDYTDTDTYKNYSHSNTEDFAAPENIVIINCVLNVPLMLISILGNALVLAAIIRTPSIRSTSMLILCSLAVSDFLVGLITQPLYIAKELTKDRFLHVIWDTMAYSICGVSLLIITAVTVDRFLALHYHMRYATLVTKPRARCTIVTIWFTNFLLSCLYFVNGFVYHLMIAVITGICLIISTICYIIIYRIVRVHQSQICAQQKAVQSSNAGNNIHMLRLKKSAVNTFVFYIILVMCYLPMYILLTLHGISHQAWPPEWNFATTLVFMNSSINPVLYYWRLRELRTAVLKTAREMLCKQSDE